MINLNKYLKTRWTLVVVTPRGERKYVFNERYYVLRKAIEAFRSDDVLYVYVKDNEKGGCVLNLRSEDDAVAVLRKYLHIHKYLVWIEDNKGFAK